MDTGSNWLWVQSRFCEDCVSGADKYDERNSTEFHFYDLVTDMFYGKGDIYGYISYDQLCIKPGVCSKDFAFLDIGLANNMALPTSGLVGLSPSADDIIGDLFVSQMKKTGAIDKAIFSLMVNFKG